MMLYNNNAIKVARLIYNLFYIYLAYYTWLINDGH